MVHVYYHIYTISGVESIIDEQIELIQRHFDFPYKLNIGISIANENTPSKPILDKIYGYNKPNYKVRDIRCKGSEWVTLDLIEEDRNKFGDNDYILYIHTKGASKQNDAKYENIKSWRALMNYFNIEKVKSVFRIFEKSDFNTYGVLYGQYGSYRMYAGNFWWMKGNYAKTLDLTKAKKHSRFYAEHHFVCMGDGFNPYSPYNKSDVDYYEIKFNREDYTK